MGEQRLLVGAAVEDGGALRAHVLGELAGQPRLADSGVADEQDELRLACHARLPRGSHTPREACAADERAVDPLRGERRRRPRALLGLELGVRRRGRGLAKEVAVQREQRRRRRRTELVAQQHANLLECPQRLGDVALARLRAHEQRISALAKRLARDERGGGALGGGQAAAPELEPRRRGDLQRVRRELLEGSSRHVDPVAVETRQQRLIEPVQHGPRGLQCLRRLLPAERLLSESGALGERVDVDL